MNKFFRSIFALLFLLTFGSSDVLARGASVSTPVSGAKVQERSSVIAPATRSVSVDNDNALEERPLVNLPDGIEQKKFPCESLQITERGAVCDGYWLDFPEVIMKDVLEGGEYLPRQSKLVFFSEKVVHGVVYRNFALILRWEPATPEFLQVYLEEYLPYWENRVPYRLFWNAVYEACSEKCSTLDEKGEVLPADVEDLSPSLAADINFNGVPAAFWDRNIKP